MYKRLYIVGFPVYIVMFALSIVFYKERTIFVDAAFELFYIIKDAGFRIQAYRFGDVFTQLAPVLARLCDASLPWILTLFSAGFVVYFFLAYIICGTFLKRPDIALVILLFNTLFVTDTFYYMISQLSLAVALLFIAVAVIDKKGDREISLPQWTVITVLLITTAFFHPLMIFVVSFALLYLAPHKFSLAGERKYFIIAAIYFTSVAVKVLFFRSYYEGSALSGMKNFVTQFPDYFSLYSNRRFLHNCLTKYYWMPVLFAAILWFYSRTKQFYKLALFALFFLGYLMLVDISYPAPSTPEFYSENLYLPLGVFLALPLVMDLLPAMETRKTATPLVIVILLTGIVRCYMAHAPYTARLDSERTYLQKYNDEKVIVKATTADTSALTMLWGTPYELLLLSETERGKPASIIIDGQPETMLWAAGITNALRVNWSTIPYSELPAQYFHFTDTTSGYRIILNR